MYTLNIHHLLLLVKIAILFNIIHLYLYLSDESHFKLKCPNSQVVQMQHSHNHLQEDCNIIFILYLLLNKMFITMHVSVCMSYPLYMLHTA